MSLIITFSDKFFSHIKTSSLIFLFLVVIPRFKFEEICFWPLSYCGVGAYLDFWRLNLWRSTNSDYGCDGQGTTSCCCQVSKDPMEQSSYLRSHFGIRRGDERKAPMSFSRPKYVKFRGLNLIFFFRRGGCNTPKFTLGAK